MRNLCILIGIFLSSGAALFAGDVNLAWDANTEPDLAGYRVYYGTAPRTYGTLIDVGNITTFKVPNLAPGTWYFAVTAYNSTGFESGYSNEVTDTIVAPPSVPPAPGNLIPADRSTGISLTPRLSWSASAGAASYDVYFGTAMPLRLVANTTALTWSPPPLNPGSTYFWGISARNSVGANGGLIQSFTTTAAPPPSAPPAPGNLIPADLSTVSGIPTLSWSSSAGATRYEVYFGRSSDPPLVTTTSSTSFTPRYLRANRIYYWRVVALNSNGSASSATFRFTMVRIQEYLRDFKGKM